MNSEVIKTILSALAFFIGFPLFWSALAVITSGIGGWATLAEMYPHHETLSAQCFSGQSATLQRSSNYRGTLKICADNEGIYCSVTFLFRPGHPPFFVPWVEISGTRQKHGLYEVVELRFQRTPNIPFRIYKRTADKLVDVANGRWAYKES
ncbi:MAG: hypothetical protein H6657_11005 [Ardenticatenaceae bacterium]|nr:hypothetical protein [Ardenticatenaceae bacterium]